MGFQRIGIFWNPAKPQGVVLAQKLIPILEARSARVVTDKHLAVALNNATLAENGYEGIDLLIVLGGDGTILSALDIAIAMDIPMLGINLGRIGFLTEVEPNDLDRDLGVLFNGGYRLEERMMMQIAGDDNDEYFALNEIAIMRNNPLVKTISLEMSANGVLIDRISGDGIIVASSTGSTAYSLSAGGPIVSPGLNCFVLTPVCPHTMNARPVVAAADDYVTLKVLDNPDGAYAVLDGRRLLKLSNEQSSVTIIKSRRTARFVRLRERNYFELLRAKLSEWTH